jgi:hypothetical protein
MCCEELRLAIYCVSGSCGFRPRRRTASSHVETASGGHYVTAAIQSEAPSVPEGDGSELTVGVVM